MLRQYSGKCSICGTVVEIYLDSEGRCCGKLVCSHFDYYEEKDGVMIFHFDLKYDREVKAEVGKY